MAFSSKRLQFLILIFFVNLQMVTGQINPFQQTFYYNWQLLNPASLDRLFIFNDSHRQLITAGHQQQWLGLEGGPVSTFISYENRPGGDRYFLKNRIKWGLVAMADRTDALSQVGFWSNFSYYFNVGRGQSVHIGLQAGLKNNFIQVDQLRYLDQEVLDLNNQNFLFVDVGMGIFYKYKQSFYAGFSIPQVFGSTSSNSSNSGYEKIKLPIFNYIIGGFWDPSPGIRIEPSLQVINRVTKDLNASEDYSSTLFRGSLRNYFVQKNTNREIFWLGGGYSTLGLINLEAGVTIQTQKEVSFFQKPPPSIRVGCNYQLATSNNIANLGTGISIDVSLLIP